MKELECMLAPGDRMHVLLVEHSCLHRHKTKARKIGRLYDDLGLVTPPVV